MWGRGRAARWAGERGVAKADQRGLGGGREGGEEGGEDLGIGGRVRIYMVSMTGHGEGMYYGTSLLGLRSCLILVVFNL